MDSVDLGKLNFVPVGAALDLVGDPVRRHIERGGWRRAVGQRDRPEPRRHRGFLRALRRRPRYLGELRRGRGQARRPGVARGMHGAGDDPRRRERHRAQASRRPQDLVRLDGHRGVADRHGVRRHHPGRAARGLADPGRPECGGSAEGRSSAAASAARNCLPHRRYWPDCPPPRCSTSPRPPSGPSAPALPRCRDAGGTGPGRRHQRLRPRPCSRSADRSTGTVLPCLWIVAVPPPKRS